MTDADAVYTPSRYSKRCAPQDAVRLHIDNVTKLSEKAVENISNRLNIAYGVKKAQKLDIFGVDLPDDSPIFVFVHGGYWMEMSREISRFPAVFMHPHGVKTIAVGYTKCPRVTIPEIVDEIHSALEYCLQYAKTQKSRGLILCGHSAGAHLISQYFTNAFQRLPLDDQHLITSIYLFAGIYDLEPLIATDYNRTLHLDNESAKTLSTLQDEQTYFGDTNVFVIVGDNDSPVFISQSKDLHAKLRLMQPHSQCKLMTMKNRDHFELVEDLGCDSNLSNFIVYFQRLLQGGD